MPLKSQQEISYWDVARMTKLPGAKVTTTVDPAQWTTVMKNKVKKFLLTGQAVGGYQSVAVALATALSKTFNIPLATTNANYVKAAYLPESLRPKIADIIKADFMAWRMENNNLANYMKYMEQRYRDEVKDVMNGELAYGFNETAFATQVRDLIKTDIPPEILERAKRACAAIDAGEHFEFVSY